MALSDYDLLALNEEGRPSSGTVTSPLGIVVEIYKDWLYVGDESSWRRGGNFTRPTVMQVNSGVVAYKDLRVLALRGPQGGVYAVVYYYDRDGVARGMIGCGTLAYVRDKLRRTRLTGVTKKSLAWFRREVRRKEKSWWSRSEWDAERGRYVTTRGYTLEYVHDVPACFRDVSFHKALRSNQGDSFLAVGMGVGGSVATPPGKATETILSAMVKSRTFKNNFKKMPNEV